MNSLILYLIELNLLLVLLFGIYFVIKNKLTFTARRFGLITIPLISVFGLYINEYFKNFNNTFNIPTIELNVITIEKVLNTNSSFINFELVLVSGGSLYLAFTIYKIIKILFLFKSAKIIQQNHYKLIITKKKDSFSFFNLIHLSAHLNQNEKDIVLEHELIHCEKKHSFDIILMEVYHAFFWYNPLLFLIKKELIHVHEYEVDQKMYGKYKVKYIKHLLAYTLGSHSSQFLLTSQFYNGVTLAKRTKIMTNKIKKSKLLVMTLPIAAITFSLISWTKLSESPVEVNSVNIVSNQEDKVYDKVDIMPEYKGGMTALGAFFGENIKYPKPSEKKGVEGKVLTQFIIDVNGNIKNATVIKGVNPEIDKEAIRVVNLMPNWIPGEKDGKRVNVKINLPIKFELSK